jgi:hypothetical protein
MAEFARASYILNDNKLNKQQRINKVNEQIPNGYKIHPKSTRDVQLFTKDGHGVIAHRGTDFSNKTKVKKDLIADVSYIAGKENEYTKQFQKRSNATKRLIKHLDPSDHLTMVGHSYGGASINHTLLKEPSIRNRVDNVELYNPLLHHAGKSKIHTKNKKETHADVDKQLNGLITIHRTKNDLASATKPRHGKVKNYKQKFHATSTANPFSDMFDKVEQVSAHSIKNFI